MDEIISGRKTVELRKFKDYLQTAKKLLLVSEDNRELLCNIKSIEKKSSLPLETWRKISPSCRTSKDFIEEMKLIGYTIDQEYLLFTLAEVEAVNFSLQDFQKLTGRKANIKRNFGKGVNGRRYIVKGGRVIYEDSDGEFSQEEYEETFAKRVRAWEEKYGQLDDDYHFYEPLS